MKKKSFYIKTLGCKVNQYESQVIRENFLRYGYQEAEGMNDAGICVVNTCTVTSTSDSKSLRLVRNAVKRGKCVVVTGCMVEDKNLDLSSLSAARYVVRNRDKYRIPEIIGGLEIGDWRLEMAGITGFKNHTRVFVKVQDGCNNLCSYCKVRIVRGRSRSRGFREVLDECELLIRRGTKEMVLTGICLGAYGRDSSRPSSLSKLVRELCKIDGQWRLRLSSIEPKDITEDLIYQIQSQKGVCKHLHIPFQSGDNFILKRMDRPYKRNDYLNLVYKLKRLIPDIGISTDIMVGFPGETEERFQNTLDFLRLARPMRIHIFPYSRRIGTKAYNYKDEVLDSVKKIREDILLNLAKDLSREFVEKFVDKERLALIEDKLSKDGYLQGYTDNYIKVYIDSPLSLKGQLTDCLLTLTNSKVCGILKLS